MNTYHELTGNLLDNHGCVICHQVNCQKTMGSGVAKQIKDTWPEVAQAYQMYFIDHPTPLGRTQLVQTNDGHVIANMYAQDRYGYDGKRYTNYEAFASCLEELNRKLADGASVAFPYKIGSDRGGANWEIIRTMIQNILTNKNIYIYRLEENN